MRAALLMLLGALSISPASGADLELQAKISLAGGHGRIDHMAFDPVSRRLFVAELGNGSVAIIDVDHHRLERRIAGLSEPQGIAYFAPLQRLYVTEGGDGGVRAYDARGYQELKRIKLSGDADNIRVDLRAQRLYVGYGDGGVAVLKPDSLEVLGDIRLKAHPESFQLSTSDGRIYVNVPDSHSIAVADSSTGDQVSSFETKWGGNYPLAIDEESQTLLTVFRKPPRLARYSSKDGSILRDVATCADADDVFLDARRKRLYVVCGQGVIDIFENGTLKLIRRLTTSPGARTGLYSSEADLLFIAVPARTGNDAAVWVWSPSP
jgi:hypothetical protein